MCLLTILIAAKRSHIAQLRYQKREKAVSLPKFEVSKGGGDVEGLERNVQLTILSCGQNRYVRLPLSKIVEVSK